MTDEHCLALLHAFYEYMRYQRPDIEAVETLHWAKEEGLRALHEAIETERNINASGMTHT